MCETPFIARIMSLCCTRVYSVLQSAVGHALNRNTTHGHVKQSDADNMWAYCKKIKRGMKQVKPTQHDYSKNSKTTHTRISSSTTTIPDPSYHASRPPLSILQSSAWVEMRALRRRRCGRRFSKWCSMAGRITSSTRRTTRL